ncbi:tyrosine-type recombinase/integrase [Candidatus Uhrbacteria bacterium]|nr:tyrosine-type recombinase/integrase [Candidatus Uhrbacteria bacterium]
MNIRELHESFCQYQEAIKNYQPNTIRSYKDTMSSFLGLNSEIQEIEQVSFLVAEKFFYWGRSEKNWKSSTYISHHKRLNVFFLWAVAREFIKVNPLDKIEKPRLEKKLPTRLTKAQSLMVIDTAANLEYSTPFLASRNHAIFSMFLYCGLRKGELLKLKCSDVDIQNLSIHIRQGKGNKDRIVPMPFTLRNTLLRYAEERQKLHKTCQEFFVSFPRDCGYTDSGLKRVVGRIKEACGFHFYIHMLRHTFATLMIEGGCDIYALSKILGHNDIKTTTIYLSASVEHLRGQMSKHPLNFV